MTRGHRWSSVAFGVLPAPTWWQPPWPAEQAPHTSLTAVALVASAALGALLTPALGATRSRRSRRAPGAAPPAGRG
ncbi:hypothetical protein [Saccharothrix yanglingensis]|uniref:hypothetical protein n=1 Tax=Saccharothrix yanglingensis TaxID=659496 RepID=UPI0027D22FE4|nr:hypothetical protein [Saccharothrix yanglingensis]